MRLKVLGRNIVTVGVMVLLMLIAVTGCPSHNDNGTGGSNSTSSAPDSPESGGANKQVKEKYYEPLFTNWSTPKVAIVITGEQLGYIEPCGCAGLENQKGGLGRRHALLKKLRSDGWPLITFDLGSQVRRSGAQAAIKYHRTREALEKLKYDALAFGLEDIRRLSIDTIDPQLYEGKAIHVGANVNIYDAPEIRPFRVIEVNGYKIGVTAIFGSEYQQLVPNSDIKFSDPQDALPQVIQEMQKENCDLLVLLSHAPLEESRKLAQKFPDFDVVVTAGGADEPPLKLEAIEGTKTKFIELGHKAMYAGVIGFFPGSNEPLRYQKVPLDSRPEFAPTEEMKQLLAEYQVELQSLGFAGLEVFPVKHPRGAGAENPRMGLFAGAESCKQCHKKAWGKWSKSNHAKATTTIIESKPPRQFDPECISCHVTGWNPQEYFPYESGFLSVEKTPHLVGNSCENCHGPGAAHVEAEKNNDYASLAKLRDMMKLRIGDAELTVCRKCHDLDNSPEFNLETYWEKVKHPGKD